MSCYKCKQKCCTCNTKCTKSCGNTSCNCVTRYNGPDIDCLGISEGDTFETVLSKLSAYVCNINFEDGVGIQNMTYDSTTDDFEVTLTDGTFYNFTGLQGDDGQSIDHTSFTSTTAGAGQPASLPGETDTYTVWGDPGETVNLGTFTVYNGLNANSTYGNTLFVDEVYGNNTTANRERFDLPYLTISAALDASQPGDTVYVRSGSYSENIVLQNDVDIYFEDVYLSGTIADNGVNVASTIRGGLNIQATNNAIAITGESTIDAELNTISTISTAILVRPTTEADVLIKVNKIVGLSINYFLTIRNNAKVTLEVYESMETQEVTQSTGFAGIEMELFTGRLNLSCPYVFIGSPVDGSGGVLIDELSTSTRGFADIKLGKVYVSYDFPANNTACINKYGGSVMYLKVDDMVTEGKNGIHIAGSTTGYLNFEGNVVCKKTPVLRYASDQVTIIKNSSLKRGSGGTDGIETVIVGSPTGVTDLPGAIETNYKLEIEDSQILKEQAAGEGEEGIVMKSGTPSVNIKNVDIYGYGTFTGSSAKTTGAGNENIFFKNTISNVNLDISVTDTSTGGFTQEPNLVLHDYTA